MKNINVDSPIELITSNTTPTTTNLPRGKIAYGKINNESKLFGNIGNEILDLTSSSNNDTLQDVVNRGNSISDQYGNKLVLNPTYLEFGTSTTPGKSYGTYSDFGIDSAIYPGGVKSRCVLLGANFGLQKGNNWTLSLNGYNETVSGSEAMKQALKNWLEIGSESGDMFKSIYDTNDDGKVNASDTADSVPFSGITSKPTTLFGYGITDAAPLSHVGSGGTTQHSLGNGTIAGFSTNDYTTSEKTKLANLESSKFLGAFEDEDSLLESYPANGTGGLWNVFVGDKTGCTADVSVNDVVHQFSYNGKDTWTDMGQTGSDTPEMIKMKYESNDNTNAYTDVEKSKLEGIQPGAEVNVQSDWNQANITADDYIKNKPTIPSPVTIVQSTGQSVTSVMSQKAVTDAISASGNGDMLKSVYDTNNDGIVNAADKADKLSTPRTIQTFLNNDSAGIFDGTTNITIGVKGVLNIENGGTGNSEGNALTATKLETARNINNIPFDGTQDITIPESVISVNGKKGTVVLNNTDVGAAATNHTHTKSQITDMPTTLPNPKVLSFSGYVTDSYDGSVAKSISIPTSLPANGGNADTVDGKHASDFATCYSGTFTPITENRGTSYIGSPVGRYSVIGNRCFVDVTFTTLIVDSGIRDVSIKSYISNFPIPPVSTAITGNISFGRDASVYLTVSDLNVMGDYTGVGVSAHLVGFESSLRSIQGSISYNYEIQQ